MASDCITPLWGTETVRLLAHEGRGGNFQRRTNSGHPTTRITAPWLSILWRELADLRRRVDYLGRKCKVNCRCRPTETKAMHDRLAGTSLLIGIGAAIGSGDQLKADIAAFIQAHNDHPKPFIWTKTADAILETIARYCSDTRAVHAAISSTNF